MTSTEAYMACQSLMKKLASVLAVGVSDEAFELACDLGDAASDLRLELGRENVARLMAERKRLRGSL